MLSAESSQRDVFSTELETLRTKLMLVEERGQHVVSAIGPLRAAVDAEAARAADWVAQFRHDLSNVQLALQVWRRLLSYWLRSAFWGFIDITVFLCGVCKGVAESAAEYGNACGECGEQHRARAERARAPGAGDDSARQQDTSNRTTGYRIFYPTTPIYDTVKSGNIYCKWSIYIWKKKMFPPMWKPYILGNRLYGIPVQW